MATLSGIMEALRLGPAWVRHETNRGPARVAEVTNCGKSLVHLHLYISTGMTDSGGEMRDDMGRQRRRRIQVDLSPTHAGQLAGIPTAENNQKLCIENSSWTAMAGARRRAPVMRANHPSVSFRSCPAGIGPRCRCALSAVGILPALGSVRLSCLLLFLWTALLAWQVTSNTQTQGTETVRKIRQQ